MRVLVTGAAGFIGSHLCDRLVGDGHEVRMVDSLTDYYDRDVKIRNLSQLMQGSDLKLDNRDLARDSIDELVDGVDAIIHLAGQPGVRLSWSSAFSLYVERNLITTQRLLESASAFGIKKFVVASSSSVYGQASSYPTSETSPTKPFSPYGVTKLAAESLCSAYAENLGLNTVALRYFTVYGPRQRPDMAFHRFIECALDGRALPVYGDGHQVRDFTYVDDIVDATVKAAEVHLEGAVTINVAGGSSAELGDVLDLVSETTGHALEINRQPAQSGDVQTTGGTIDRASELLGWRPTVSLSEGLARQTAWHVGLR
jgi:UDP-glucuronate 4-epimerase